MYCDGPYIELTPEEEELFCGRVRMTVTQYDPKTDEELKTISGTFREIFDSLPGFGSFYYRLSYFGHDHSNTRVKTTYLGTDIESYSSFCYEESVQLNRLLNGYVSGYAKGHRFETDPFLLLRRRAEWFECANEERLSLDEAAFQNCVSSFLSRHTEFLPVTELGTLKGKRGIYMLVLDKYRSSYIGQSVDLKRRILQHWSINDYGGGNGIDLYKAHDTTRLFALVMDDEQYRNVNKTENICTGDYGDEFSLNVVPGGDVSDVVSGLNSRIDDFYERALLKALIEESSWLRANWNKFDLER